MMDAIKRMFTKQQKGLTIGSLRFPFWASSGKVDENTALKLAAVYACVQVLSQDVAALPLILYRRTDEMGDKKERARKHPLYNILHNKPNPFMTSFMWRIVSMLHLGTWGNSYHEIVRDRAGRVASIWPINPARVTPKSPDGKSLVYEVQYPNNKIIFPDTDILHYRGLSTDGIIGLSPISAGSVAIQQGLDVQAAAGNILRNGAMPGGVLMHPANLSKPAQDRLTAKFEERHQGPDNIGRFAVLEEGMKFEQVGIPARDAQMLETRQFNVQEIARFYRIPPHKLGDLSRATFSNIEQQSIEYVVNTLTPWLVNIEQEISAKLLTEKEQAEFFPEFLVDGQLRGDLKSRYDAYGVALTNGFMTPNEVRTRENLNPVAGGDTLRAPLNTAPIGDAGGNQ